MDMNNIRPNLVKDVHEAFKKIRKAPAFSIRGGCCKYRGPENTKCVIGHIIPDSMYDMEIEGDIVQNSQKVQNVIKNVYGELNADEWYYLSKAQQFHDDSSSSYAIPKDTTCTFRNFKQSLKEAEGE